MLGMSFTGTLTAEARYHEPLVDRLVAAMKRVRFRHRDNFDALTSPVRGGDKNAAMSALLCH